MRVLSYIFYLIIAGVLLHGCIKKYDVEEQRYTWKTEAPLTIPAKTRLQRLEKINILRNPSFESGRTYIIDSLKTSFVIDGWQQVGKNVEWVDIQDSTHYQVDEAFSGQRAIKIIRKEASETDEKGDGIMSEFVKVIPGNYRLSFFTKLKNVFPSKARIGTRMYDAVDIKLLFYDRNKLEVSSKFHFPYIDQYVDLSNKSLSFANYHSIEDFNWGEIIGKTYSFPFPEGDIPSEAHYVRIFIGLKGSGTMWIDSVNFNYTSSNFTVGERMSEYTDTTFVLNNSIIPRPKYYRKMQSIILETSGTTKSQLPVIVVPDHADDLTMDAARMIQKALMDKLKNINVEYSIPITHSYASGQVDESKLIISIGKTSLVNHIEKKPAPFTINSSGDAYQIYPLTSNPNIIIIKGNTSRGLFYASTTVVQMIDRNKPVFHSARINDYPDFDNRFYALGSLSNINEVNIQAGYANDLVLYKINGAFYNKDSVVNDNRLTLLRGKLVELFNGNDVFKLAGIPSMLPPDDTTLTYSLPLNRKSCDFILRHIDNPSRGRITNMDNMSLAPLFNNQLMDYALYEQLQFPFNSNTTYLYSGNSYFSMNTDVADIRRFTEYSGSGPVFIDNSMISNSEWAGFSGNDPYYPGKIRLYNIFEPFPNESLKSILPYLNKEAFIVNQPVNSEIDIIRLATAADFMWNSNSYNKDLSIWKVLVTRYNAEASYELVNYAGFFGSLLEAVTILKASDPSSRVIKDGQQALDNLKNCTDNIASILGLQHKLVLELKQLNQTYEQLLLDHEN